MLSKIFPKGIFGFPGTIYVVEPSIRGYQVGERDGHFSQCFGVDQVESASRVKEYSVAFIPVDLSVKDQR
jgi:hypothetical protein